MSENFTGITFSKQKVAPSDDAIIRRAVLADGVLKGCDMSYSGSTLTMAAGQMIICGRQIRHPSAQNWAVVDATSGYARLLLTIDLSRTSSKDVFDQVIDSIEYATSADGFPELVQEDINGSGSRYQIAACIVALGTGGISDIVYQIGQCVTYADRLYPVGSIYISTVDTSPASFIGGTWERLKDRFLLAAGDAFPPLTAGGEAVHALTVSEIAAHKHASQGWYTLPKSVDTSSTRYVMARFQVNSDPIDENNPILNAGGSQPHNNMPPYLAVYMWKRAA